MRHARGFWLAVAVVLAAGTVSGGDPDVAGLLFKKAKKAFSSKDYAEAESGFRRAIKELTPYPDARFGLAESLEKLDRPREAFEEYRNCVAEIDAAGAPSKWKSLRTRAQQAMARVQGRHAELAKVNEAFVRKYVDFAKDYAKSDPAWARKAVDLALLLDPANEAARKILKTLPASGAPAQEEPKPVAKEQAKTGLYRRSLWSGAPDWSVESDTIVGDVKGRDGRLFWLEQMPVTGKYAISGRYRITRDGGARRAYGIFVGGDMKMRFWAVIVGDTEEIVLDHFEDGPPTRAKGFILEKFDHAAWHTLRVEVEPGRLKALLDGNVVIEHDVEDPRTFDGHISLFIQNACVEWKDLGIEQ